MLRSPGMLRPVGPRFNEHVITTRTNLHPALPGRLSSRARQASSEENPTTASAAVPSEADVSESDQHKQTAEGPAQAAAVIEAPTSPTAAATSGVERDWLHPPPGDWGGVVDPQGIKEPDSSGVILFFVLIAGLSLGVHQLISRLIGLRAPEQQLMRPPAGPAAVIAAPESRASPRPALPASTYEASVEASAAPSGTAQPMSGREAERPAATAAVTAASSIEGAVEAQAARSGGSGEQAGPGEEVRAGSRGGAFQALGTGSETGMEDGADAESASEEGWEHGAVAVRQQQQRERPPEASQAPVGTPQGVLTDDAAASQPQRSAEASGAAEAALAAALGTSTRADVGVRGDTLPSSSAPSPPKPAAAPTQTAEREPFGREWAAGPGARGASPPLLASTAGGDERPGPLSKPGRALGPQGQAGPGPGSTADAGGLPSLPRAAGAFPPGSGALGFSGDRAGGAPACSAPDSTGPARLTLPAVRPEPLSRAPDSSALAHLPRDDSLASLRERAQLALRAAAAAGEASQRTAAYAAAASSAASRAAEAAERAAAAATMAQAGLESAAESAIAAAEARVAQAAEAAKEAEGRAASAAAHATAYQDMSQSQADIAERAAAVAKPPAPGPLSQLQQLWRSASSAFSHAHSHSHQEEQQEPGPTDGPSSARAGSESSDQGTSPSFRGGPAGDVGGSQGSGHGTAETIGSTVKGLLWWLGQGDGTR